MRSISRVLAACLAVFTMPALAAPPARPVVERVVLVTVASLRADRLGWASRTRRPTPRLDALAEKGALFARARTPASSTVPAAVSLMTGRHPQAHRVLASSDGGVDLPTLAGILSAAGYVTLAALADPSLEAVPHLRKGFDRMVATPRPAAPVLARQATDLLETLAPDERFFLWVHFNDCTAPYHPPVSDLLEFTADGGHSVWDFSLRTGTEPSTPDVLPAGARNGPLRSAAFYLDAYDATVRQVDRGIGLLWDRLVAKDRHEDTLFVVASLHGEALGEHGYWFSHGQTLYEEELQVPVLFRGPGVGAFREENRSVSLLDLTPTLVAVLGARPPRSDGLDLSSRLSGRFPVGVRYHYAAQAIAPFARTLLAEGRFKLIFRPPRPPQVEGAGWWPREEHRELYDISDDPFEAEAIDRVRVTIANELQLWLQDHYPAIPGSPPAEDRSRHR